MNLIKIIKNIYLPVTFLTLITGCVNREAQKQAKVTEKILSDPVQLVEIYEAKPEKFEEGLRVKGNIVAPQDTNISSKISGRISQIFVKEGEKIKANQVLAVLENSELKDLLNNSESQVKSATATLEKAKINVNMSAYKTDTAIKSAYAQLEVAKTSLKKAKLGGRDQEKFQAKAALNAAKSSLDIASKKVHRYKRLYDAEAISLQDLEGAQNAHQLALAQYEQAKESLSMSSGARKEDINMAEQQVVIAEQTLKSALISKKLDDIAYQDLKLAEAGYKSALTGRSLALQSLQNTMIKAPFSGHISGKSVSIGTVVAPGTALMRLTSEGNYYIKAEVSEKDYCVLKIGNQCQINIPALSNKMINGRLAGISPDLETVGRLLTARVDFSDNVKGLIPGMYAEIQIFLKNYADTWFVPAEAVLNNNYESYVFIVRDNIAFKKEIKIIKRVDNRIQVTGLQLGDRIVVKGQNGLSSGTKVRNQK